MQIHFASASFLAYAHIYNVSKIVQLPREHCLNFEKFVLFFVLRESKNLLAELLRDSDTYFAGQVKPTDVILEKNRTLEDLDEYENMAFFIYGLNEIDHDLLVNHIISKHRKSTVNPRERGKTGTCVVCKTTRSRLYCIQCSILKNITLSEKVFVCAKL